MPKNQDSLNSELFDLLRSRGYKPEPLDSSGQQVPVPGEAEVFQFQFIKDGEDYGPARVSIDGLHKLVVYFGDDIASSPKAGPDNWYSLLKHLRRFARDHQLSFQTSDQDNLRYDMAKRSYNKKEGLREGYYPVNKKTSYSDNVPTVKLRIQHNKEMNEGEQRYRHISKIFIENTEGERILAPTTKPGLARVYARHIAEGGKPNDERWNHINSVCEEYNNMGGFIRATKNKQFNESAERLVTEAVNHYLGLRETLHRMSGKKGYNAYFESWTPSLMEAEEQVDLSEMFMSSSLDPRIECAMPVLSRLSKNLGETKLAEVSALEEWADSVIEHAADGDPLPGEEADYGDDYQAMVQRVGQKAREQEKKKPVDIQALAKRLNQPEKKEQLDEFLPALAAIGGEMAGGAIAGELGLGATGTQVAKTAGSAIAQDLATDDEETNEGLDKNQQKAGQLGPTSKVKTGRILGNKPQSQQGLRGKLVGASESVDPLARFKKLSGLE